MEFKINRETIPAAEVIFSGIQEQGVELDYILPDYCPDIFRLVRCEIIPVITDRSLNGDKLTYELGCTISLIYCGEDGALQCITQNQSFSRTAELGRTAESPEIQLIPKTDHVNFRAVNKRRLDVRGAVSVKLTVMGETPQEVVSDAFGMNIQLKKIPLKFVSKRLNAEKLIQLSEETELSPAQPSVGGIIRSRCCVTACEKKLISGKLLAKGDISVKVLYSCDGGIEPLEYTMPFSQIIDMEGIDDTFDCTVTAEVTGCNITPVSDKTGDNRVLRLEPEVRIGCRAVKTSELMVAADAYSTVFPCDAAVDLIRAEQIPAVYSDSFRHTAKLAEGDGMPKKIFAMWCTPKNINTRVGADGRSVVISGMLTYSMAAEDNSGAVVMPDRDEAFEETVELGDEVKGAVSADISEIAVSYNISSEGVLTAKADIPVKISVSGSEGIKAVTAINIDDSAKKERDGDYAIKLYFSGENESAWDIAKRYSTEVAAIMEENELTEDAVESGCMLLIPIRE